ncbi:MAG: hypothetical protein LRY67_07080 [Gammaproteobacteria bacterium]|nr:hypothetical protein [Gammaproteobacteria bacterium]
MLHILKIINTQLEQDKISSVKAKKLLNLFVSSVNAICTMVKMQSVLGIMQLINKKILPTENIEEIFNLLSINCAGTYGVKKNALRGLSLLVKLYQLTPEILQTAIDTFLVGAKDAKTDIRQISLLGLSEAVERIKLPIRKAAELLEFLEERVNIESCDSSRNKALVVLKKMVESNNIPENMVEKILKLFKTKKEEGKLHFKGITEGEKEEISSIIDGSTIEKLKNT